MYKKVRIFLGSSVFLLFGCAPIVEKEYTFYPPSTLEGERCANECALTENNCATQCDLERNHCEKNSRQTEVATELLNDFKEDKTAETAAQKSSLSEPVEESCRRYAKKCEMQCQLLRRFRFQ